MTVGTSNERGERPKDRPIRVEDIAATIYRTLGVDYEKEYVSPENRPLKINYDGEPVKDPQLSKRDAAAPRLKEAKVLPRYGA